jgi:uncharacterized damage-inducible protein DinB
VDAIGIIRDLLAHMQWADATVWSAVRRLGKEDADLHDRLRHLHGTQWAFLQLWRSERVTFDPPADLREWAHSYYVELAEFFASVDAAALDRPVKMPWADRFARRTADPTTLGETMLQISSHSSYHRGQVNTRIRQMGGEPPLVDYIAWLWLGRSVATWD